MAKVSNAMKRTLFVISAILLLISLSSCGGNKILKEPQSIELQGPLAVSADSRLAVALDWVIVRDGPGTWSKNVDWDEYLLRATNLSDDAISIDSIVIFDSLETMIESSSSRKQLIRESKAASKRYKEEGLQVKAGLGGAGLVAVGGATFATGAAVIAGSSLASAAVGAAFVGAVVIAPVLAVGGVFRGINNSKVSTEIENRSSDLPMTIDAIHEIAVDAFFPLSPSPVRIEINYSDADHTYVLAINTSEALSGLHLRAPEQVVTSE
jgi:hypothetical protein